MAAESTTEPQFGYVSATDSVTNAPAGDAPFMQGDRDQHESTRAFDKLLRGLSNPIDVAPAKDEMGSVSDVSLVPLPVVTGTTDASSSETAAWPEHREAPRSAQTIDATPAEVETPTFDPAAEMVTSHPMPTLDPGAASVHYGSDFASDADSLIPGWRSESHGDLHSYLR